MRSASAIVVATALLAAGCTTTQQRNDRAKLSAKRLLESRRALLVTTPTPDVAVERVGLAKRGRSVAVAVVLRNRTQQALTDLPVTVGLRARGRKDRPLNHAGGLGYFQTHVAALGPGERTVWVFSTRRARHLRGTPYAVVGAPAARRPRIPAIAVSPAGPGSARVMNDSGIPQDHVPVYAYARRGERVVLAGRASVPHLAPGAAKDVRLSLTGAADGAPLVLDAQPTTFD